MAGTTAAVDFLAGLDDLDSPVTAEDRRGRLLSSMAAVHAHEQELLGVLEPAVRALPGVTLACADTRNHALAVHALARCCERLDFARVVLFTDALPDSIARPPGLAVQPIAPLHSRDDYSRFVLEELVRHPETNRLVRDLMVETEMVAGKLGIELPISIDQRMAGAEKVGAHKTSMLQDWEAGRPMELEAVVGAVVELGERLGVPMPSTRAVYACAKLLDEHRGQRVLASKVTSQTEGVAS